MGHSIITSEFNALFRKCLVLGRTGGYLEISVLNPDLNEPIKNFSSSDVGLGQ